MTQVMEPSAAAAFIGAIGSSMFALVLVGALALLSFVGAVVPQDGDFDVGRLVRWKQDHPGWTAVLDPVGAFGTFRSWPFLVVTGFLAANTLVCTALRYVREGGLAGIRRHGVARRTGFYLLHLSLVILIVAGFFSFGTAFSAHLVLTEGQTLKEARESYVSVSAGPLRDTPHRGGDVTLTSVQEEFADREHRTAVTSHLVVRMGDQVLVAGDVRYNQPLSVGDLSYVQSENGYSPKLGIRRPGGHMSLVESFVALQTGYTTGVRSYRDFLPVPFLENRIVVELIPNCEERDGAHVPVGQALGTPALRVEAQAQDGTVLSSAVVHRGEWTSVGKHEIGFLDLRRWSSFRVTEDRVYPTVWLALWLAVGAMSLRYWPDLSTWFREGPPAVQGGDDGRTV